MAGHARVILGDGIVDILLGEVDDIQMAFDTEIKDWAREHHLFTETVKRMTDLAVFLQERLVIDFASESFLESIVALEAGLVLGVQERYPCAYRYTDEQAYSSDKSSHEASRSKESIDAAPNRAVNLVDVLGDE